MRDLTDDEAERMVDNLNNPEYPVGFHLARVVAGTKMARGHSRRGKPGDWWNSDIMELSLRHRYNTTEMGEAG